MFFMFHNLFFYFLYMYYVHAGFKIMENTYYLNANITVVMQNISYQLFTFKTVHFNSLHEVSGTASYPLLSLLS